MSLSEQLHSVVIGCLIVLHQVDAIDETIPNNPFVLSIEKGTSVAIEVKSSRRSLHSVIDTKNRHQLRERINNHIVEVWRFLHRNYQCTIFYGNGQRAWIPEINSLFRIQRQDQRSLSKFRSPIDLPCILRRKNQIQIGVTKGRESWQ